MSALQIFEPDGRAIPFVEEGEGPVAIVLLPAQGMGVGYLGTLTHVLEEEGFHLVRIGPRAATDAVLTLHDLAQDVVDVLDHLGLRSAYLAGHAFGGALARTVALDHHDRVEGLLLLGVQSTEPLAAEASAALETAFSDADEPEQLAAMRVLAGERLGAELVWNAFSRSRDAAAARMQAAALEATPEAEWTTLADSLPILVLQGTEDRVTPVGNGDALQATAPERASAARIDGGGHLFVLTHAGELGMQIEDYLAWD